MNDFICGSFLAFDDNTAEGMVLHRGDRASCERMADMIPALAYNGSKHVIESQLLVLSEADWTGIWDQPSRDSDA